MNEWITQLRKGLLEFCILNILGRGEEYGYTIVQRLREVESLATTESTVYPILARLLKDGLLKVRVVPSPEGPPRRYFSLTVLGKHRVREMGEYWDELNASLAKVRGDGKGDTNG
jgi:PadR family transcriptional regulator, regulatory protein PadR